MGEALSPMRLSLVTVTIDRQFAIQRLVRSVRANFPDIRIHVVDQSGPSALMERFYARYDVDVIAGAQKRLRNPCAGTSSRRNSWSCAFLAGAVPRSPAGSTPAEGALPGGRVRLRHDITPAANMLTNPIAPARK